MKSNARESVAEHLLRRRYSDDQMAREQRQIQRLLLSDRRWIDG